MLVCLAQRMILACGTEREAEQVLKLFQTDAACFHALKKESNPNKMEEVYSSRSPFPTLAVWRLKAGAHSCFCLPHADFAHHMQDRTKAVVSIKPVGDMNNPTRGMLHRQVVGAPGAEGTKQL